MDIVTLNSAPVKNPVRKKRTVSVRGEKSRRADRRRNRTDRRKSVRNGVVVSLSYPNDRRSGYDRRQAIAE
jgi:hypothetical protein